MFTAPTSDRDTSWGSPTTVMEVSAAAGAPSKTSTLAASGLVPGVPGPNKPQELDITGVGVGLFESCQDSSKSSRFACESEPAVPTVPSGASDAESMAKRQSDFTFPVNESLPPGSSDKQRILAVIGPHKDMVKLFQSDDSSVVAYLVSTMEELREALSDLKARRQKTCSEELYLMHLFPSDSEGRPLLDGLAVSETELYSQILSMGFTGVSVFQLVLCTSAVLRAAQTCGAAICSAESSQSRSAESVGSISGSVDFYSFEKEAGKHDWVRLLQAVGQAVAWASTQEELTGKQVADRLSDELSVFCPELKFRQQSGVPSNERVRSLPEALELEEHNEQEFMAGGRIPSKQPIQPDPEDPSQSYLSSDSPDVDHDQRTRHRHHEHYNCPTALLPSPEAECNESSGCNKGVLRCQLNEKSERNAAVGITLQNYGPAKSHDLDNREGAEKDNALIYGISKKLHCAHEDIFLMLEKWPSMSKKQIQEYIEWVADKVIRSSESDQEQRLRQKLFLFLSGHGCDGGIVTSLGEKVSLEVLMQPLLRIARHLMVIYQPCRGSREHLVGHRPVLCGLSLPADQTAGCCLPQANRSCSAMFASLPGYASYRHSTDGSQMLLALHDVVHTSELAGKQLDVQQLTQLTQSRVVQRFPYFQDKFRMQYAQRGSCSSIRISDDISPLSDEPKIPDVWQPFTIRL